MAQAIAGSNRDRTGRLMTIAAVVFATVAAGLVFVALNQGSGDDGGTSTAAITQEVVVATRDIGVNETITTDAIELRSVEPDELLDGAYARLDAAIGFPARFPIQQGEQITTVKVGADVITDEKDVALVLEPGRRGFSVEATEVTAVGGLLLPGNRVDVIAVREPDEEGAATQALTVLQDIEVIGVAQEAQEPVPATSSEATEASGEASELSGQGVQGQRPEDVERQPGARSVTLAVTAEQAQTLAALQSQNDVSLWLSLRPAGEGEPVDLIGTNLIGLYPPPPTPSPSP